MKIRISFTVDVDPDAWQLEYGVDRADVRRDVQQAIEQGTLAHLDALGLTTTEVQYTRHD